MLHPQLVEFFAPARDNCAILKHGKLYPCYVIGNIEHPNKLFNRKFKVTHNDYVDIYKVNSLEEILDFYKKGQPFRKYRAYAQNRYKRAVSPEHTIDEWVRKV